MLFNFLHLAIILGMLIRKNISANCPTWTAIAAGNGYSLAIRSDDSNIYTWGTAAYSLGNSSLGLSVSTPTKVTVTGRTFTAIAAGTDFGNAIADNQYRYGWGANNNYQLGNTTAGSYSSNAQFVGPAFPLYYWGQVFISGQSSLGIGAADQRISGWGDNTNGQIGYQVTNPEITPTPLSVLSTWLTAAISSTHSLGIQTNNGLYSWGRESNGALGTGSNSGLTKNYSNILPGTYWQSVACFDYHSFGVKTDGTLWAWGWNNLGALGFGDTTQRNTPTQVGSATTWTKVYAAYGSVIALRSDGSAYAWGDNSYGKLGDGTTSYRQVPTLITNGTFNLTSIAIGDYHTLGLRSDGYLLTWGRNNLSQLGDGTTNDNYHPTLINNNGSCSIPCTFPQTYISGTICLSCDTTCATCNGGLSTNCLTCNSTYVFNPAPAYQCLPACPVGMVNVSGTCQSCDASCLTCTSTAVTGCATCFSTSVFNPTNHTCLSACPSGTVNISGTCQNCDPSCSTCNSTAATGCTACSSSSNVLFLPNSSCLSACPSGYINSSGTCLSCHPTCLTCSILNDPTACTSCASGLMSLSTNHSCVSSCPSGYFNSSNSCFQCSSSCSTCSGTAISCTSCPSGHYLNSLTSSCVTSCPSGTFLVSTTSTCVSCDSNCSTCLGTSTNCTSCATGYIVSESDNKCYPPCTVDTWQSPKLAPSCVWLGTCYIACKSGMCLSSGEDQCTACLDPIANLTEGSCICPSGYSISEDTGMCTPGVQCDPSRTCARSDLNDCACRIQSTIIPQLASGNTQSVTQSSSSWIVTAAAVGSTSNSVSSGGTSTSSNSGSSSSNTLGTTYSIPSNPTTTVPITVSLPPTLAKDTNQNDGNLVLLMATYNNNPYSSSDSSKNISSDTLTLALVNTSGAPVTVQNLSEPINITFTFTNSSVLAYLEAMRIQPLWFPPENLTNILNSSFYCRYWDDASGTWKGEGLTLVELTYTNITCQTTHCTDFAIEFVQVGVQTLLNTNTAAIGSEDNWRRIFDVPIYENVGAYVVLAMILLYVILVAFGMCKDSEELEKMEIEMIIFEAEESLRQLEGIAETREREQEKKKIPIETPDATTNRKNDLIIVDMQNGDQSEENTRSPITPPTAKSKKSMDEKSAMKRMVMSAHHLFMKNVSKVKKSLKIAPEEEKETSRSPNNITFPDREAPNEMMVQSVKLVKKADNEFSVPQLIIPKPKLEEPVVVMVAEPTQDEDPTFWTLFVRATKTLHPVPNSIFVPSRFSTRTARITLYFLRLLVQTVFSIVFYGPVKDNYALTIEVKIWQALYSALITIPIMYIVIYYFRVPKEYLREVLDAPRKDVASLMDNIALRIRCRYIVSFTLFGIASLCSFAYIMVFCAEIQSDQSQNWIEIVLTSYLVDQIPIELSTIIFLSMMARLSMKYKNRGIALLINKVHSKGLSMKFQKAMLIG